MHNRTAIVCALSSTLVVGLALRPLPSQEQRAANAQRGAIFGAVTDTALSPIADADIEFVGTSIHVKSNLNGRFLVTSLPPGSYIVIARRVAFQPSVNVADVRAGDTLRLAFLLAPSATELPPTLVTEHSATARLREFEERRANGVGEFFTQEQIEARNVQGVVDLLAQSKTIRLKQAGLGTVALSRRNFAYDCYVQVYVDGVPLVGLNGGPVDIMTLPSPKEIMGIEIYAGAATTPIWLPADRGISHTGCGTIMLWTRDGSKDLGK